MRDVISVKSITKMSCELADDEEAVLTVQKRSRSVTPYYYRYGSGKENKRMSTPPIDAMEAMFSMTPQEQYMMLLLKEDVLRLTDKGKYEVTCKVHINTLNMTKQERNKLSIGYKRLAAKKYVLRIQRGGYYMVNPGLLVPAAYSEEVEEWEALVNKHDNHRASKAQ